MAGWQVISRRPKFSDKWAQDNLYDQEAVKEHLKVARCCSKNGKDKEIMCKVLGTCLEAACQYGKDNIKEKQELKTKVETRKTNELLSLQIEQMSLLQEEQKEKQKLGEKVELIVMQAPKPPHIVHIGKLIASPED